MEVRPRRVARSADAAQHAAARDPLPSADADRRKVRVERAHVPAVADDDEIAEAAARPAGPDDAPGAGGPDAGAVPGEEVEAGVETVPARAEAVADACGDRPGERERGAGRPAAERPIRRAPGRAVGGEAGAALEADERPSGARPEDTVDGPGRKAVRAEAELEGRDVPAAPAHNEEPGAVARTGVPAEGSPSLRAEDAVDC